MKMRLLSARAAAVVVSSLVLVGAADQAGAAVNLLTNGDFSSYTQGQVGVNGALTGWTAFGKEGGFGNPKRAPVMVYPNGTLKTGIAGDAFMGTVSFFNATAAPDNGIVVGADGDPAWAGGITQTVSDLTAGSDYTLTFNFAAAQQQGFSGDTTEQWKVTFGSAIQSTALQSLPSKSFIGWQSASMTFTADSDSQLLSLAAIGTPSGSQPWLLIDNVVLAPATATPEPASLTLLGLGGAAMLARRRRSAKA